MAKQRKFRSDSVTAQVLAYRAALRSAPEPPAHLHLNKHHLPFWQAIFSTRPTGWQAAELPFAAELCRVLYDIQVIQKRLDAEGYVVLSEKTGLPITNPLLRLEDKLFRLSITLTRFLRLHPAATEKKSKAKLRDDE